MYDNKGKKKSDIRKGLKERVIRKKTDFKRYSRQNFLNQLRISQLIINGEMIGEGQTKKEERYFKLLIKIRWSDQTKTLCPFYHQSCFLIAPVPCASFSGYLFFMILRIQDRFNLQLSSEKHKLELREGRERKKLWVVLYWLHSQPHFIQYITTIADVMCLLWLLYILIFFVLRHIYPATASPLPVCMDFCNHSNARYPI